MTADPGTHLARWIERSDISARSLLVTILGDVVRPIGPTIWLAQLFTLTEPFGFSERLVRTSLSRLAADGWVESERIGRQSRYSMTALALSESDDADQRIYGRVDPSWDGAWTMAVVDAVDVDRAVDTERVVQQLRWQGFVALDRRVFVAPRVGDGGGVAAEELDVTVGEVRFDERSTQRLISRLADAELDDDYREFDELYRPFVGAGGLRPRDAYRLRVAMLHDWRRLVLRTPVLPAELRTADWPGHAALETAAALYRELADRCRSWLSSALDVDYPAEIGNRFD